MVQFRVLVVISPLSSNFTLPLTFWIYLGISHEGTFNLIPNCMESCYGQISIETATYSLGKNETSHGKGLDICVSLAFVTIRNV